MQLSIKYWKYHIGRTIALISTIMISTMAMTIGVLLARSASETDVQKKLDTCGDYDIVAPLIEKEQLCLLDENKDIAQWGIIWNGGTCKADASADLYFGAMDSPEVQKLFHYEPEKNGRYPEAEGEICGYKSSFESLGTAAVVGNKINLALYDPTGSFVKEKEFTIVGVLNDQREAYDNVIRSTQYLVGDNPDKTEFPEMFVHPDEIPEHGTMTALVLCAPNVNRYEAANSMRVQGIKVCDGTRLPELSSIAMVAFETEQELLDRAHLSYHDFYSSFLIPVFMGIVLIVSFISIYGVMSTAMLERQKQLGLLRSMGMNKHRMGRLLFGEAAFFCFIGVAIGYVIGLLAYALYIQAVNSFGQVRIYSAFRVHPIAAAVSLDPYLYPWLFGLIFSALAVAVPFVRGNNLSPNEMLFPEKLTAIKEKHGKRTGRGIIRKIVGGNLSEESGVTAVIVITGWSFVFGAVFMLAKADCDSVFSLKKLEEVSSAGADYSVSKDLDHTKLAIAQFNRHNEGISAEDMDILQQSGDIASVRGIIKLPGLKLLYRKGEITKELRDVLGRMDISNNVADFLQELDQKSREAQGYEPDDLLYSLPAVAVDSDLLDELEQYVVSGGIDRDGLRNGSKIIMAVYSEEGSENPYGVGDQVTLTDTVIYDPYVESFDFSTNEIPEGYKENFTYDYSDGSATGLPGYSFGEKVDFQATVCAVLFIDDEALGNLLYFESQTMNEKWNGMVSPGYGIICSTEALADWGLPDRCYTDVYVNLDKRADTDRFEIMWYTIVGKSGKVNSVSRKSIKNRIARTELSNMVLFVSMIILIIVTGCFGMVNNYSFAIRKSMKNIQIMRAVGMSRKKLTHVYIREMFLWPFVAVVTSLVPIQIFDMVRKYAYHYAFDLNHNSFTVAENGKSVICWQALFPWYIEMWNQPVISVMIIAFATLVLVNICAGIVPMRGLKKMNIAEGIRNDCF